MAEQIAQWATSPDRAVTVLAAPGGLPLEVRLSNEAMRQSPDALAHAVLTAATTAGRLATTRLHQELVASFGPAATSTMQRAGLPAPADDTDDHDDPDDGGVLERWR